MAKVLVVPENVNMFGIKLAKGEYTSDKLEALKCSSQAIANLVGHTAAHWKIKQPAQVKTKTAKAAE